MSAQEIITMISTVGFPIIACIFLWRYISTSMKEITTSMIHNTAVLTKLAEKIDEVGRFDNVDH